MTESQPQILRILEAMGHAAALIATDGAIVAQNEPGDRMLQKMFKAVATSAQPPRLPASFLAALEVNAPGPAFLNVGRARPIVAHRLSVQIGNRLAYLLVVVDLNVLAGPRAEGLQRGFGLTPCEARLAAALSTGMSLQEVARMNGVEIGTVRGQLKSVFIKTATKRQPELVAMLARFGGFAEKTDRGA
jgi:DNA-binding CsgD family transcriptional regulator